MVYVRIESINDSAYEASYMPESSTARPGRIMFNPETGDRKLLSKSPDDCAPNSWFVGHAFKELEYMVSQVPVKMEGRAEWW